MTQSPQFTFDTGALTDKGCVRERNEDNYITKPEAGVWVVADGMGGHEAGDFASGRIVETIDSIGVSVSNIDLQARFVDRITRAHNDIMERSQEMGGATIGATMVALLIHEEKVACVWSGDSRIYRLRDGELTQVTTDHTEAEELLAAGSITAEQAENWPRKNVITRAIGVTDSPKLEQVFANLRAGDVFVLCSDGLTGHVEDNEIASALSAGTAQDAADGLVKMTLARGATDNVTVVVVGCKAADVKQAEEPAAIEQPTPEKPVIETTLTPRDIDWSIGSKT